ncbi:viral protein 1 [Sciurus carolinensis polyomavirus 1]|uniref:Major capsid protein VP1 n=1 Tax=Sciurus carolinensis polyomavirus 1 TaxID=2721750 RepID=A0A6G9LW83_9POLY|nr:viral protein 1 [Sciurus carolinensis polyomavirus 1]QIQ69373.1 viral protein 1 [Sciurus carolinensis polyomavirus 1]
MPPKGKGLQKTLVPKLIIKGGVEVLAVKTGPDSTVEIESYLNPRMGDAASGSSSSHITVAADNANDHPQPSEIPCWSCGRIQLPLLNTDMTCGEIVMWEAISVKTEVVGITTCLNSHSTRKRWIDGNGPGYPYEGPSFHCFAVGGEPLELQGIMANSQSTFDERQVNCPVRENHASQILDVRNKAVLDRDNAYPIEHWVPDPSKNENTRYFGTLHGGVQTPPVLQITNSVVTVLLDENGVGPLCKGDGLFLSCADVVGWQVDQGNRAYWRGLPRYFNVKLRKRLVKNPYPINSLLSSLFTSLNPKITGQPMEGANTQVEEVRVYQGQEELPSDPDMVRYIDKFGQGQTRLPQPAN